MLDLYPGLKCSQMINQEIKEMNKIEVLDHGYVRLIDSMGSDLSVVRAARVSYNADWRAGTDTGSDEKLIRYLWKNKHTSPFEAVTFTFEVKCPMFIGEQWLRHRTWSFNKISGRYTELPEEFYIPDIFVIGQQSKSNKQARDLKQINDDLLEERKAELARYEMFCEDAFNEYRSLIASGWPRELARMVLPASTYTRFFASVNLLNLFKFIQLRDHEHAQWEIQQYAKAVSELIKAAVPVCHEVFISDK